LYLGVVDQVLQGICLCEYLYRLMYASNRLLLTCWSAALRYMLWRMLLLPGVRWIVFLHSR